MKKTKVLNLLAGLFLIPAFFYLSSCEKEDIETSENDSVVQSEFQLYEQENTGLLAPTDELIDKTDRLLFDDGSSKDKFEVAIKSFLCLDHSHRTLVAVKANDPTYKLDEQKQYELFWFRGKDKKMLAKNSKLECVCGDKFTVVVWHKNRLKRYSATVKVPCQNKPQPQDPDKTEIDKF